MKYWFDYVFTILFTFVSFYYYEATLFAYIHERNKKNYLEQCCHKNLRNIFYSIFLYTQMVVVISSVDKMLQDLWNANNFFH